MINTSVFCPYERVLSLAIVKLCGIASFRGGWFSLSFDDGYTTGKVNIEANPVIDRALGRSETDRQKLLARDKFSVVCNISDKDGAGYTRTINVENSLLTDEPPASFLEEGGKKLTNGTTADGTSIMYPEAYFTTEGNAFSISKRENVRPALLRPLFQYIILSIEGENWLVAGPSNLLFKYTKVGDATVRQYSSVEKKSIGVDYTLVEEGDFRPEIVASSSTAQSVEKQKFGRWEVALSDDTYETPFVFSVRPRGLNGSYLRGEGIFDIMRALVYLENSGDITPEAFQKAVAALGVRTRENVLVIPVQIFNGYTRITPAVHDAIDLYAANNSAVVQALAGFTVIKDALAFKAPGDGNQYYAFAGVEQGTSTFCLSLVNLIADAQLTGSWTDVFQSIPLAVKVGLIEGAGQIPEMPAGVLGIKGSTSKLLGAIAEYKFDTLRATASVRLTRQDYNKSDLSKLKNGLYILGYSFAEDINSHNNDMYMVVELTNGILRVVIDPSAAAPYPAHYNVTDKLDNSDESALIGLISDGTIGGVAMTNGDKEALGV